MVAVLKSHVTNEFPAYRGNEHSQRPTLMITCIL